MEEADAVHGGGVWSLEMQMDKNDLATKRLGRRTRKLRVGDPCGCVLHDEYESIGIWRTGTVTYIKRTKVTVKFYALNLGPWPQRRKYFSSLCTE